jgi:hypothetical protein
MISVLLCNIGTCFSQECKSLTHPIDKKKLEIYGVCYLKNNKTKIKNFTIPQEMSTQYPGIVYLILESKSISDAKEKQSWFDLYPLMNNAQIEKLYDILIRESDKLADIEETYQKKQDEINEKYAKAFSSAPVPKLTEANSREFRHLVEHKDRLSSYIYQFLGSTTPFTNIQMWRFDFDTDSLICTANSSLKVHYDDFFIFKPQIGEKYNYSYLIEDYITTIFGLTAENNNDYSENIYLSTLPNYSISFLRYGIWYYYTNKRFKELRRLLSIDPYEIEGCILNEEFKKYDESYNEYTAYYNDAIKEYQKACKAHLLNFQRGYNDTYLRNPRSILFRLYNMTIYEANNCENSSELNLNILNKLDKISISNLSVIQQIEADLLIIEFIKLFNTNEKVISNLDEIEKLPKLEK